MTRGILGRALLCTGLLAILALPAHAQAIGSIFGKVTDSSGAVLPGVNVSVAGTGLQTPLTSTTTESGAYQFPSVPIGTYTVTFELQGFKKAVRNEVLITSGFNAGIDQKLEIGQMTDEVTVSSESPVVDLKKTITGAVFTAEVLEKIPTARDPWQIANMTPGVSLSGYNVGGSQSGQQLTPSVRGSTASVQWNLEGGFDHRPVVELVVHLLQLRLVRSDPGDDRRRRRLGAVERPGDQPGDQERQQQLQGDVQRHLRERRDPGPERHRGAVQLRRRRLPVGQSAAQDWRLLDRGRRPDREGQALVLGIVRQAGHQRRHHQLLRRHQGSALQRPRHGAEAEHPGHDDHLRQPG